MDESHIEATVNDQTNGDQKRSNILPAEGERAAISGYEAQYLAAAEIILGTLREDRLEWIRVADPAAGRLDDFIIGTPHRVDAYQFKWSTYPGAFTFIDLTKSQGGQPCLLAQLADGWSCLHSMYGTERRVTVHLVTNQFPATSRRLASLDPPPRPNHFAAFIEQAWKPVHNAAITAAEVVPSSWRPTWNVLQEASELDAVQFNAFVRDCELTFSAKAPISGPPEDRAQQARYESLHAIARLLREIVGHPQRIIELTRDQILVRLGWENRYDLRHRHEFPVDELLYEPVETSAHQLDATLSALEQGYIAVTGTPGSGKSTLVTQVLRHRPERVIRYYAYVPDSAEPMSSRGESENFLHDVVLTLRRAGFAADNRSGGFDRTALLQQFHEQLQLLHQDWLNTGRKTILSIDGLDHIEREQHPNRSLLHDLPSAEQVPPGVLIIVGSQTDTVLPSRIQHTVQTPNRRVEMQPLSREAVTRILTRSTVLGDITAQQMEAVYTISGGHPLAFMYLIQELAITPDTVTRNAVLNDARPYSGAISDQYHAYWNSIERADSDLAHILGIAARMRRFVDLEALTRWYGAASVRKFRRDAAHFFRHESESRWYFFHNSFRLFIVEATGRTGTAEDRLLHQELATHCANESAGSFWAWEELYHRAMAGDHARVLERATQTYFREQAHQLRPNDAIQADIVVALHTARTARDAVALARLAFAMSELDRRAYHLSDTSPVELLLNLGKIGIAIEHVRSGNRIRIKPEAALQLCPKLFEAGLVEEAQRVFELAEPGDLLASAEPLTDHLLYSDEGRLRHWAEASVMFRPLHTIIERIQGITREADLAAQWSPEEATADLQNVLLYRAGLGLLRAAKWEELSILEAEFNPTHRTDRDWWFWLRAHAWRACAEAGDDVRARTYLQGTIDALDGVLDDPEKRTVIADGVLRILGDLFQTCGWLDGVPQPNAPDFVAAGRKGMYPFLQRLRLNRLLTACGDRRSPNEIIPDAKNPGDQGLVYFERGVITLARLWGMIDRGECIDLGSLQQELPGLLRLFERSTTERRRWTGWYLALEARSEFYAYLVHAIAGHGNDALALLRDRFEREWTAPDTAHHWPTDVKRQVILAFARCGVSCDWVEEHLRQLADELHTSQGSVPDRLAEHLKQADAWLAVADSEAAEHELMLLARNAFGPRLEEDYQLDEWIRWLGKVNALDPTMADGRIAWFAEAIVALDRLTEDHAPPKSASNKLLEVASRHNPQRALQAYFWLLERRLIDFSGAVAAFLQAALDASSPPYRHIDLVLREVLLPIATEPKPVLMAGHVKSLATQFDLENLIQQVSALLVSINRDAPPSTRSRWKAAIRDSLLEAGLRPEDLNIDDERLILSTSSSDSAAKLRLSDGSELTTEQVAACVETIADLETLRNKEAAESYFSWRPIMSRLAEQVDADGIEALASMIRSEPEASGVLSLLAERLLALGRRPAAFRLAEEAFELARPYEWVPGWYYGGAKLQAARTMIAVGSVPASERVWAGFTADLTSGNADLPRLSQSLDEILSVVAPDVSILGLWPVVEDHVAALLAISEPAPSPFSSASSTMKDDSIERMLVDFLSGHIDHPVHILRQGAEGALGQLMIGGDSASAAAITELPALPESRQQQILAVLDAASSDDSTWMEPILSGIEPLCSSPNFAIHQLARQLMQRAGHELRYDDGTSAVELPALYQLSFPDGRERSIAKPPDLRVGVPLAAEGTPEELISPFDEEYERVALLGEVDFEALCFRASQLIPGLRAADPWISLDEAHLMDDLDAAGLRMTWLRPRATLARRALDHIVAELVAAGRLGFDEIRHLECPLRWHDPAFVLRAPDQRPALIPPMVVPTTMSDDSGEAWLMDVGAEEAHVTHRFDDDRVVLAELTRLKVVQHGSLTSWRRSVIAPATRQVFEPTHLQKLPVERVYNRIVADYRAARPVEMFDEDSLVSENISHFIDRAGTGWLAFRPDLGMALGWIQDPEGLFRWRDEAGQLMVESLWWTDGRIENAMHQERDEVGEGWMVIATENAMVVLVDRYPSLRRFMAVGREFTRGHVPASTQAPVKSVILPLP